MLIADISGLLCYVQVKINYYYMERLYGVLDMYQYFQPILKRLYGHTSFIKYESPSFIAVIHGHLEILKWVCQNKIFYLRFYQLPCIYEHLHIIKWMYYNKLGVPLHIEHAIGSGNLDIIIWIHELGYRTCSTDAMDYAAKKGYLHIVKWLHTNRTEGCTTYAVDQAVYYGHFEVVKWLCENRTEFGTSDALYNARHNMAEYLLSIGADKWP